MPSDHVIADTAAFQKSIERGIPAASGGDIVTFGVKPNKPETGYGYIEIGTSTDSGAYAVNRFVEKPAFKKAEEYLHAGNFLSNAGIFLYAGQTMIDAYAEHAPDTLRNTTAALNRAQTDLDFLRLDHAAYAQCETNRSTMQLSRKEVPSHACRSRMIGMTLGPGRHCGKSGVKTALAMSPTVMSCA